MKGNSAMRSCDTNIFLYYFDDSCPEHKNAERYLSGILSDPAFVICDLVLIELFVLLQNKKIFARPKSGIEALRYCSSLRSNPVWQVLEYSSGAMDQVWKELKASRLTPTHVYDRRLAAVLKKHGVTEFATRNTKDFRELGFQKLINPID